MYLFLVKKIFTLIKPIKGVHRKSSTNEAKKKLLLFKETRETNQIQAF